MNDGHGGAGLAEDRREEEEELKAEFRERGMLMKRNCEKVQSEGRRFGILTNQSWAVAGFRSIRPETASG